MVSRREFTFFLPLLFAYGTRNIAAFRVKSQRLNGAVNARSAIRPAFFLIQLADPQLGMKNLAEKTVEAAKDFSDELSNLQDAVAKIQGLKPQLVVMSGDMQNFWSQKLSKNMVLGPDSGLGDYGNVQAKAVKDTMDVLQYEKIPVVYTPGNHDLDDHMTIGDINRYKGIWGADSGSFQIGDVLFLSINSQLYYESEEDASKDIAGLRQEQTRFIEAQIQKAQKTQPKAIVVLTHIPPFIGSPEEKHGWANWDESFRTEVLGKLMGRAGATVLPELFLCGHFHANVRSPALVHGTQIEVVTTGSVGASMLWNNTGTNEYTSQHASKIAEAPTGGGAFLKHILDGSWANEDELAPQRVLTRKDLSGVRIVQFYTNGQYRHKWFTLNDFEKVYAVDDESMSGAFTSAKWEEPEAEDEERRAN